MTQLLRQSGILRILHWFRLPRVIRRWQVEFGFLNLLVVYLVSRSVYWVMGLRFDASPLPYFWQFLPVRLLKEDLVESLAHLHSQPPLFNFFLGIGVKFFDRPEIFYHATQLMLCFSLVCFLALFLVRAGLPRKWALWATAVFAVNPSLALYAHFLFYTIWESFFIFGALLSLFLFSQNPARTRYLWFASLACAGLMLTRYMFQPVWYVGFLLALGFVAVRSGFKFTRAQLAVLAFPLAVGAGLVLKNYATTGHLTTSSWFGMNIANVVLPTIDREVLQKHVERGEVSPIALVGPFRPLDEYRSLIPQRTPTGVEALDWDMKLSGQPNFNHLAYIDVSRALKKDMFWLIRQYPETYWNRVKSGFSLFFQPSSHYYFVEKNYDTIRGIDNVYSQLVAPFGNSTPIEAAFTAVLLFLAAVVFRPSFLRSCIFPESLRAFALPAAFALVTLVYMALVGNLFEYAENNRFRFSVDPVVFALSVALVYYASRAGAIRRKGSMATVVHRSRVS